MAATGLGKTSMMAGIARHWPQGRVMLISHRYELNTQAMKEFERINGEPVDLEQAQYFADRTRKHRCVVASVQTLNSARKGRLRMQRFEPREFGLLLIDEAHHATAPGYRRVIEYFEGGNPDVRTVGVTATPDRLDGVGMGHVFNEVAADLNLLWAINNGWLVAPRQQFCQIDGLDLDAVRTIGGDLDEKQLAKLVEREQALHQMAEPIVDALGTEKQGIVFTASVAQAHRLAELVRDYALRKLGAPLNVVALDGSMTPDDPRRVQMIRDFKSGLVRAICNCGVLTEGFDHPAVEVVAIGRPTKSRALYQQMLGRGTRALPGVVDGHPHAEARKAAIAASGKPSCLVIDFHGQATRHKLICSTDILAGNAEPEVVEAAKVIQRQNGFQRTSLDALREAQEQKAAREEAARARVTAKVHYRMLDAGELYDMSQIPQVATPNYMRHKPATEKQAKLLLKLGFSERQIAKMNPRSASQAINYAIENPKTSLARWMAKNPRPPREPSR